MKGQEGEKMNAIPDILSPVLIHYKDSYHYVETWLQS